MSLQHQIYLRNAGLIRESVEQFDELSRDALIESALSRLTDEEADLIEEIIEEIIEESVLNTVGIAISRLSEEFQQIDEISAGTKIRAYAGRSDRAFDKDEYGDFKGAKKDSERADKIMSNIRRKHGEKAAGHAERAASSAIFGRDDPHGHGDGGKDVLHGGLRANKNQSLTKAGKIPKSTQNAMKNTIKGYGGRGRNIGGPKGSLK